jgi:hypothetical protein
MGNPRGLDRTYASEYQLTQIDRATYLEKVTRKSLLAFSARNLGAGRSKMNELREKAIHRIDWVIQPAPEVKNQINSASLGIL